MVSKFLEETIGMVEIPELHLESGRVLKKVRQAYAVYGSLDARGVVLVCHALTGSHHVAGPDVPGLPEAWWDPLVGPGKAIDTERFCILCFNVLGSPYGSTSPLSPCDDDGRPYGMRFPVFSVRDMVKAQHEALKIIGIEKLECVIGGSLGGMQALEWAVMFPEVVKRSVVIAAPAFTYPQAIAFNEVQRQAIMADSQWRGGDYYNSAPPERGLAIARMLAMITYRSEETFVKRYMRELAFGAPWDWDGKFKIETYIHHHGEKLVQRFDANCYLYLTRAMDLHDIGEGRGGVKKALSMIGGQLLAVGISSDLLFPNWQVEGIVSEAREAGAEAFYDEIESDNGHDAFLIDLDQLDDILRGFWKRTMMY